jgi:hypothetical protein
MLPGFTADTALAGPRNVYHGRGRHEPTLDSAIAPQQNMRVLRVTGGDADCVCPCCLYVSGLGKRCCNSA